MVTATTGPAAQIQTAPAGNGGLNTFISALNLFKGGSSTTTNNVSQTGINELVNSILRGNQGLATVAGGQKAAGVYNSTVNTQMINDLVTSAAAKGELARSSTTTKQAAPLSGNMLLQLAGSMVAQKLLGPSLKKIGSPLDEFGTKISDAIFGGTSSSSSMSPVGEALGNSSELAAMSNASSASGAVVGGLSNAGIGSALLADGTIAGAGEVGGFLASANATADPLGAFIGSLGFDVSAAGAGSAAATAAGAAEVGTAVAGAAEGTGLIATLTEVGTWLTSLFSDERLKTDINPVGKTNDGQQIYTYKYIDNPITTHMGVMAQESPANAVMVDPITKYLRVNYSKIK